MEAVGFEFALNKVVAKEIRGGKEISTELVLPSREISLRVNDALGSLEKPLSFNGSPIYIKLKKVGVEADRENKFKCALKCLHDLGTSAGKVKGDYRNEHINLICDEQTITLAVIVEDPECVATVKFDRAACKEHNIDIDAWEKRIKALEQNNSKKVVDMSRFS